VKLSFGGDVMFEKQLQELLEQPASGLAPIRAAVAAADFTMVNLESALTSRGTRDPKELEAADNRYHFRTGTAALTALRAAGVDAVSLANNHGVDFGAEGLSDTLRAKRSAVLPVIGVGRNRAEAFGPHQVTLKGQPFAFFAADASFLESTEPYWQAGPTTPGLAAARGPGRATLLAAVERAASGGAAAVVYLHWGKENSAAVTAEQKALARALARAGAAAVVGTHTHRLQGAGWLGSTYVSYGLGNFIWYHGSGGESGLLDLTVKNGRVVADGFRPARIPREGGLPRFLRGTSAAEARQNWRTLRSGSGLAAAPSRPASVPPVFAASVSPITTAMRRRMASSHRAGCPVPLEDLRYLRLSYWDFAGRLRTGELVIAAEHAEAVVTVFRKLYAAKFPIQRMKLVSDYGGDDERSMAANNTSAFNCRTVAGTDRWSQHSFGAAIDLNPVQNPYVTEAEVSPRAGEPFALPRARRAGVKGLITADSVVVRAFREAGWEWGGDWTSPKDYQHFSAAGS
jgi:poly-gamma-glutamate synthesis protein (capsule biosynthesis protein)